MKVLIKRGVWKNAQDEILKAAVTKCGEDHLPHIFTSTSRIAKQKSVFLGHVSKVTTVKEVNQVILVVKGSKKFSKATYPAIYAYRLTEKSKFGETLVVQQGNLKTHT